MPAWVISSEPFYFQGKPQQYLGHLGIPRWNSEFKDLFCSTDIVVDTEGTYFHI